MSTIEAISSTGYTGPVGRQLVTAPTAPVLRLDEVRMRLRVPYTDEDVDLQALTDAAVEEVEQALGRRLAPQTWRWWYDGPPSGLSVWLPEPARTVIVTTYSTADAAVILSASDYTLDLYRSRVVVDSTATWPPSGLRDTNALSIEAAVGYATVAAIPASVTQAVFLRVQGGYLRGSEEPGDAAIREAAVARLLAPYRYRMGVS